MAYCKEFKGVLRSTNFQNHALSLVRVRCKKWSCPYCAEKNAMMWRVSLTKQIMEKFGLTKWGFFTVTIGLKDFHSLSPDERLKRSSIIFKKNCDRLMKRLRRQYGNFAYVRVLEQCKNGQLHAHFLAHIHFADLYKEPRKAKDKKTVYMVSVSKSLKKAVIECGFGWASHAENLSDAEGNWEAKRVVGYITKYITKESELIAEFCRDHKIRKMQTSRHFISPFNDKNKEDSEADWFISVPIHITLAQSIDFDVYDLNRKKTLSPDDFTISEYYPPDEGKDYQSFLSSSSRKD